MEIVCFVFLILEYLIKNCFLYTDLVVDLLGEKIVSEHKSYCIINCIRYLSVIKLISLSEYVIKLKKRVIK